MTSLPEFLLARIEDMERPAATLLADLEGECAEDYAGMVDEKGPMTPARLLFALQAASNNGQSKRRSWARGHQIANLADPQSRIAECQAQRALVTSYRSAVAAAAAIDGATNPGQKLVTAGMVSGLQIAMQLLASLHSEHPEYNPAWASLGGKQ